MPGFFIFNGEFYGENEPVIGPSNRSFRYGDGLFETIRLKDGRIPLLNYHLERLISGLQILQFDLTPGFSIQFLEGEMLRLCRKNNLEKSARIRLNVFRGSGGVTDPENLKPNFIIQCDSLPELSNEFDERGLTVDIYPSAKKSNDALSNLKSNNYLVYLMAALHAKKNGLDDCLVLNTHDSVIDSVIANVFLVRKGMVITPPLHEGCIAGVMRKCILEKIQSLGIKVQEKIITGSEVESAEEVFLTNAVSGIRWVKQFHTSKFKSEISSLIHREIVLRLFNS